MSKRHDVDTQKHQSRCCLSCGGTMVLVNISPKSASKPETRMFYCIDCERTLAVEMEYAGNAGVVSA